MKFCPNCGTELKSEWILCKNCNFRIPINEKLLNNSQNTTDLLRPKPSIPKSLVFKTEPKKIGYGFISSLFVLIGFITEMLANRNSNIITLGSIGIIFGILGVILGSIGMKRDDPPCLAGLGLFIGITVVLLGIFFISFGAISFQY